MRRIQRQPLSEETLQALAEKQADTDHKAGMDGFNATRQWKLERGKKGGPLTAVLSTLKRMAGATERCMYCEDSHGTDIEHYWPKTAFPFRMFVWENLLLCCGECGRIKGERFPFHDGLPALVDPTVEDPWDVLDFDPDTGNIVARYILEAGIWHPRGQKTVEVLHLDRREGMANALLKSFRMLSRKASASLDGSAVGTDSIVADLIESDNHGLLAWCIRGSGRSRDPFRRLAEERPEVWNRLVSWVESPFGQHT